MAVSFPEAWEYLVVDPEIEELMGLFRADAMASLGLPRGGPAAAGFRIGRGNPNSAPLREAPARPGREGGGKPRVLPELVCPCGLAFRPRRATTVYCSNPCRKKYTGLLPTACRGCRAEFRPRRSEVLFCSRPCSNRATAAARAVRKK